MRFLVTLSEPRARDGATKDVEQLLAVTKSFSQFHAKVCLNRDSRGLDGRFVTSFSVSSNE